MKTRKLVSGILNCILCALIGFQSCAVGLVESMKKTEGLEGGAGLIVAILILTGGIISIATRNSNKIGSDIALIIIYFIAGVIGLSFAKIYGDLKIWSIWALINTAAACLSIILKNKKKNEVKE